MRAIISTNERLSRIVVWLEFIFDLMMAYIPRVCEITPNARVIKDNTHINSISVMAEDGWNENEMLWLRSMVIDYIINLVACCWLNSIYEISHPLPITWNILNIKSLDKILTILNLQVNFSRISIVLEIFSFS